MLMYLPHHTQTHVCTVSCCVCRFEQLEQFHYSLQHPVPFHKVLSKFAAAAQLSGPYFLADMSNMVSLARVLRRLEEELDLEEMYTWCISPAGADDPAVLQVGFTWHYTSLSIDIGIHLWPISCDVSTVWYSY